MPAMLLSDLFRLQCAPLTWTNVRFDSFLLWTENPRDFNWFFPQFENRMRRPRNVRSDTRVYSRQVEGRLCTFSFAYVTRCTRNSWCLSMSYGRSCLWHDAMDICAPYSSQWLTWSVLLGMSASGLILLFVLPVSLFIVLTCSVRPFAICDPYQRNKCTFELFFLNANESAGQSKTLLLPPSLSADVFAGLCSRRHRTNRNYCIGSSWIHNFTLCYTMLCLFSFSVDFETTFLSALFDGSPLQWFLSIRNAIHTRAIVAAAARRTRENFGRQ